MRFFPGSQWRRGPRGRAVTALVLGAVLLGTATVAVADELDDKKDKVEEKIDKAEKSHDESSAALEAATAALLRAQSDLVAAQANLSRARGELAAAQALDRQMQAKLDAAIRRLEQAQADLAAGKAEVAAQEQELRAMVVASYEQGDPALMGLSMVFTSQDPTQLAGQMNANASVMNVQSATLDRLEAAKVLLEVKEQETAEAKAEVAKKRQEAAENLLRMQSLEQQAEAMEAQVAEMVNLRAQARTAAMKAKNADLAELAKLEAERDRIEELILAQANTGGVYTGPSTGNGFLDYPVPGSITSPFGWRTHPIWGYRSLHDGIDFGSACGTPIKAPASGTVLAQYYQSAWGNRIIVNHGTKFGVNVSTISNHLSGYAVSVGDTVKRGQVIGYVGTTGWSTGCHLHFTVLQDGAAVDPMRWF